MSNFKVNVFNLLFFILISFNVLASENKKNFINIESDQLINKQNPLISEFIGKVYANDSVNHFWGDKMIVEYDEDKKIKFIIIKDNVKIKRVNEEATGNFASYDPKKEVIEVLGDVIVIKDGNILYGEKLIIDLISSTSIITGNKNKQVSVKINK